MLTAVSQRKSKKKLFITFVKRSLSDIEIMNQLIENDLNFTGAQM